MNGNRLDIVELPTDSENANTMLFEHAHGKLYKYCQ